MLRNLIPTPPFDVCRVVGVVLAATFACVLILSRHSSAFGSSPFQGHTHNWVVNGAIAKPQLNIGNAYPRIGDIITVDAINGSNADMDECTNRTFSCQFAGMGWHAPDGVEVTAWSDGGAGGQFGKMVTGVFTPCPAAEVTPYIKSRNRGELQR